jgi:glucose-1-phosphate adenylyltransferase
VVRESVLINDTWIGPGAVIDRAIIDENVIVGPGTQLGYGEDMTPNHDMPDKLSTGITVVGAGAHIPGGLTIGRNVLIHSNRLESDFPEGATDIPSGETI